MGKIRLDKYLADMGLGTRSQGKQQIRKKRDGKWEIVKTPDYKIDIEEDRVAAGGKCLAYETFSYYMLYKPQGVVSATEDKRDKTVLDLLVSKKRKDLFPVGRLDKDTEGLLLITNDGELAHNLLAPKKHVDKTYLVKLRYSVSEEDLKQLESGVDIGEKRKLCLPQLTGIREKKTRYC